MIKKDFMKRVVGYYPEWGIWGKNDNYTPDKIPFKKLTHLYYAFIDIDPTNNKLKFLDQHAALKVNLPYLKVAKKNYPHLKMVFSIGGWASSRYFHQVAETENSRSIFSDACVSLLRQWNFDGIDIDWEFPTNKFRTNKFSRDIVSTEIETYPLLIKTLRNKLDQASHDDGKEYLLTAAVTINPKINTKIMPETYSQYLDFINIMSYDIHGAFDEVTGHQSPLYQNPYEPYNQETKAFFNVDAAMRFFVNRGVPRNKLILGTPFYSRGWGNVTGTPVISELPGLFQPGKPTASGKWNSNNFSHKEGIHPYYRIEEMLNPSSQYYDHSYKKYRDNWAKVPYIYSRSKGIFYTYEDVTSVTGKMKYVNANGYGGVIIWNITGDDKERSMLTAICMELFGQEDVVSSTANQPFTNSESFVNLTPNTANEMEVKGSTVLPIEGSVRFNVVANQGCSVTPQINFGENILPITIGSSIAITDVKPGTYPVTVSPLSDGNYTTTIQPSVVSVSPDQESVVNITINNVSKNKYGNLELTIIAKDYSFTPVIAVDGVEYQMNFGSTKNFTNCAIGSHSVIFVGGTDGNGIYVATINPENIVVRENAMTTVLIDINRETMSKLINVSCNKKVIPINSITYLMEITLKNNTDQTINNWEFGFNFKDKINDAHCAVAFDNRGGRYFITGLSSNRTFAVNEEKVINLTISKESDDANLTNVTINGLSLCNEAEIAPSAAGGSIRISAGGIDYGFTPTVTISGIRHTIPIGTTSIINNLLVGSCTIDSEKFEDANYIYNPIIVPKNVMIQTGQIESVYFSYQRVPKSFVPAILNISVAATAFPIIPQISVDTANYTIFQGATKSLEVTPGNYNISAKILEDCNNYYIPTVDNSIVNVTDMAKDVSVTYRSEFKNQTSSKEN